MTTLNRIKTIEYPEKTITLSYDEGINGIGRLSRMSDGAGITTWAYDAHGRVASKTLQSGAVALILSYKYDNFGRLEKITYPSGQVVTYTYQNGQLNAITSNKAPLISNLHYLPFSLADSWNWANGTAYLREFDKDGNFYKYSLGDGRERELKYDLADRIKDFIYDDAALNANFRL